VRIDSTVEPDSLEQASRQALHEAEQRGAAFLEMNGQVFHEAINHPDVELVCYDLSCSQHTVQEVREVASSIHGSPMLLAGPLFTCALSQTRVDEFYLPDGSEHALLDHWGGRAVLCQPGNAVGRPLIGHT
jgi:hypothetical protein